MNDDWTKDIQRLMADSEAKAPDGLLDDIKAEMVRRGLSATTPRKAQVVPLWGYRWVAAAAVALLIVLPIVWKLMPEKTVVATVEESGKTEVEPQKTPVSSVPQPILAVSQGNAFEKFLPLRHDGFVTVVQAADGGTAMVVSPSQDEEKDKGEVVEKNASLSDEVRSGNDKKKPLRQYGESLEQYDEADWHHKDGSALSLTAYYGGSANGSDGGNAMPVVMSDAPVYGMYPADMTTSEINRLYNGLQEKPKAHHKQPIKVGVSVGYRLGNRWALQTGVTYSYLSTDFTSDRLAMRTQKLHYVGVPLTASYSVLRGRKAEVYVTAGGEVEKLVKGTMKSENFEAENVKESRPQLSVKAAVGGAYNFTPGVGVYVEPGVTHYFDNHSSVVNIYKDRPTSFSLNLGLRININK